MSDEGAQVNQHLVCVNEDDTVRYDSEQNLADYWKRSEELSDFEVIERKYKLFAYNRRQIKGRFLSAFRGNTLYYKILNAIAPRFYQKYVLENYKREQLLRIAKSLESERYAEDVLSAIKYMLEK